MHPNHRLSVVDSDLAALVRDREKALDDARDARAEARAKAWETYENDRAALLKKLARREEAKAA